MKKTAIELIHEAATNAPRGSLDNPVYRNQSIELFSFANSAHKQNVYVNVPVDKVVGLSRDDFFSEKKTWREVTFRLNGVGWSHDVFDYFESSLRKNVFFLRHQAVMSFDC